MKCTGCGRVLHETARACSACFTQVTEAVTEQQLRDNERDLLERMVRPIAAALAQDRLSLWAEREAQRDRVVTLTAQLATARAVLRDCREVFKREGYKLDSLGLDIARVLEGET